MNPKYLMHVVVVGLLLSVVSGCGSSDSSNDPLPDGVIQIVNAITDAPTLSVEIELDDDVAQTFSDLSFQDATGFTQMVQDTYTISVRYEDPNSGSDQNLISDQEFTIAPDMVQTLVLRGSFVSPDLLILERPLTVFSDEEDVDEIEVQVLNLSADTAAIYLGDPSSGLSGDTLLGTVTSGSNTEPDVLTDEENSTYRLRLTGDSSSTVLYDSGDFDIPTDSRRFIVITDNVGPDPDTKSAFLLTEGGSTVFANKVAKTGLRVANLVADDGSISVTITNPATSETLTTNTLDFPDLSDFVTVDPSFINVTLELASDPGTPINSTVSLSGDTFFTVVVGGSVLEDVVAIQSVSGDIRSIATAASIQFVNGLRTTSIEDFDRVDLYALPIGDSLGDAAPTFGQVGFLGGESGSLPATTFDLVVTTAGTQVILAGPIRVNVEGSTELFVAATEGFGGGLPNQVLVNSIPLN